MTPSFGLGMTFFDLLWKRNKGSDNRNKKKEEKKKCQLRQNDARLSNSIPLWICSIKRNQHFLSNFQANWNKLLIIEY